ncbi:hypothetical protein FEI13_04020 [Halomonas urmiana]|uniref:Right-handed parallel beta-helix repeat-containing protein n=1 Tax=Halomonas urmiana TaxID=490901 RepID=A0A5R8MLI0_9GAMM|nr:DUF6519 domain-containing protein [Halomonas urmiana]TLF52877.1 hypothetical protein FEI13_04020 [Halomonas urmiana]
MSFDLSRVRFDARRDFLGVVMQQGRVQLDADWNEWVAQLARRLQAGTLDTLGGNAVPRITPEGFRIEASGGALTIGVGRIYVDGLLAENHGGPPEAWASRLAEAVGTAPLDYSDQPYYPEPPALPEGPGPHLVYADVWQREVTAVIDPTLIEPAVGVETTGRLQTVWQVKVLPEVGDIGCTTDPADIPGWPAAIAPSGARLITATAATTPEPDPCRVPPQAGYRGLENQLYRVEVHTGGALGSATFKWSRDNASVASRVTHINPARTRITVESLGRDEVLGFHAGDWVEVTDDWRELHGLPGELRRIRPGDGVDATARTLEFDVALTDGWFPVDGQDATDATRHTRVRRWDQSGQVRLEDGSPLAGHDLDAPGSSGEISIPPAGTRLLLEHGILVEFDLDPAGSDFHSGDHWVFTARSEQADIERLDRAPPLGIHHHYARLALVSFPDDETDCRTLWPPLPADESCACTICVSAEGHNDGTATIQQAIDAIKDSGGTLCLGIGRYAIDTPLDVHDARSLRIRGQGWATLLVGQRPGTLLDVADGTGVAVEDFTVIGVASEGVTPLMAVRDTIDFRAEHLNVLGLAATNDATSVAIGLTGNLLGVRIEACALVAERGIARVAGGDRDYLLTGELHIARNLILADRRGISLDGLCLHYASTRLEGNLALLGREAAIVATGATLPGSPLAITDNVIHTLGDGIRAGVDALAIEGNDITGQQGSGDGIVLEKGLDPIALDGVRVCRNRLRTLGGHAIVVTHRLEEAVVADNHIDGIGLGALVMSEGGAAGQLRLSGNHCDRLGLAVSGDDLAFAALQLVRVERGEVLDNVLAHVARQAVASPAIDALRAVGVGQLRIAGNRFHGIGPDRSAGPIVAARLLLPLDHLVFADNSIDRLGDDDPSPSLAEWRALEITPTPRRSPRYRAAAAFVMAERDTDAAAAARAAPAYVVTDTLVSALPVAVGQVSIRGNRLRAHFSSTPLIRCASVDTCLFADNVCEAIVEEGAKEPLLGQLSARALNASHNRLIAPGDFQTLWLFPVGHQQAIVIGNTSTGPIDVPTGSPVPPDITLTNLIGI